MMTMTIDGYLFHHRQKSNSFQSFSGGQEIFDKSVDSLRSFLLNPVAHLMMMMMVMTMTMMTRVRDDDGNGDD